jgi:hypothetical protein
MGSSKAGPLALGQHEFTAGTAVLDGKAREFTSKELQPNRKTKVSTAQSCTWHKMPRRLRPKRHSALMKPLF